jgi:hypothetical protein
MSWILTEHWFAPYRDDVEARLCGRWPQNESGITSAPNGRTRAQFEALAFDGESTGHAGFMKELRKGRAALLIALCMGVLLMRDVLGDPDWPAKTAGTSCPTSTPPSARSPNPPRTTRRQITPGTAPRPPCLRATGSSKGSVRQAGDCSQGVPPIATPKNISDQPESTGADDVSVFCRADEIRAPVTSSLRAAGTRP